MDSKKQVEAKIREAVPESVHTVPARESCAQCEHDRRRCNHPNKWSPSKEMKRTLNLQDILIAIENRFDGYADSLHPEQHYGLGEEIDKAFLNIIHRFDLTKDFHNQSDELYSFLHSLLC